MTKADLKMFFSHLMYGFCLPLRRARPVPFSRMRIAGNNCNGVDKRIAREYKNCTALTKATVKPFEEEKNLNLEEVRK